MNLPLPKTLVAVPIEIPDDATIATLDLRELPPNWREANNPECIQRGSAWIRSRSSLALRVPSAVNSEEWNILLNPAHADISRCRVSDPVELAHDRRIFSPFPAGRRGRTKPSR